MADYRWSDLEAAIGQDFSDGEIHVAAETVEQTGIRRFCEVVELGCPLHWDKDAARAHGYPGLVLPISAISFSYTAAPLWEPGQPTRWSTKGVHGVMNTPAVRPPGPSMPAPATAFAFATDIEVECLLPVCVGDRLARRGNKLVSVKVRDTSVGSGAFVVTEATVLNQRGQIVALLRSGGYRYNPHPPGHQPAETRPPAASTARPLLAPTPPRADWSESLGWDEVKEGDELPAVSVLITVQRLVIAAGANRDFNTVHHDTVLTQQTGVEEMYANNVFIQAVWERTVREYIGAAGSIRRLGPFRMRAFNLAGDTIVTRGTVKRKFRQDDGCWLELEMWSENDRGISVGPGSVLVTVPQTRERTSAVGGGEEGTRTPTPRGT